MDYYDDYADKYVAQDEFATKIRDLITEEVKSTISDTVKNLEQARVEIESLQRKNNELSSQVYKHKNDIANAIKERDLAYRREICGGYIVGDKFFYAETKGVRKNCDSCRGKGKVEALVAGVEMDIPCPSCRGEGKIHRWIYSPIEDEVNSVHLSFYDRGGASRATHYGCKGGSSERLKERMKKTLEECRTWCDAENEKNLKK